MLRIIGGRQNGKTSSIIAYAVRTESNILVANQRMAAAVFDTADRMGLIGPEDWKNRKNGRYTIGNVEILAFHQVFRPQRGSDYRKRMVADELEMILEAENIVGYSVSYVDNLPEEVRRMPGPVAYKPQDFKVTTYRKIMRMSQIELASFFSSCFFGSCPPGYKADISCICPCTKCWSDWLNEEVDEDG